MYYIRKISNIHNCKCSCLIYFYTPKTQYLCGEENGFQFIKRRCNSPKLWKYIPGFICSDFCTPMYRISNSRKSIYLGTIVCRNKTVSGIAGNHILRNRIMEPVLDAFYKCTWVEIHWVMLLGSSRSLSVRKTENRKQKFKPQFSFWWPLFINLLIIGRKRPQNLFHMSVLKHFTTITFLVVFLI